jgi:adenine specific DNA methylase Mod
MTKEQKFYKSLQDVFIGATIEGTGGFVNLMRIKSNYYRKIEELLKKDIDTALEKYPAFRDELFDKLYSFFNRYFTESGSIYFNSTPFHNNIYEKVYTDEKDVILFWKTQMLYYVKTDRIFRSLEFESDGFKFYFDASKIEHKKANEKRLLVFELDKVKEDGTIVFDVQYAEGNKKTKPEEILKVVKKKGISITEEQLERAFRVFEKQSEVDFFINKNAKAFLQEQFKLWSYQYFWEGAKEWGADRVNQLQILKDIAFKIIDFISQFEDELVKIWNKPKFVKNSNYVITLDRIKDINLIEKILKRKNIKEQIKEWQELGIVDEKFEISGILEKDLTGKHLNKKYEHLPLDTKYFKDLELEILSQFEDLDKSLNGWLIKSENYQALNTILPKFKEKVQTIYIDPPFNTGDDFEYVDRYQDSSWLTLMKNRLDLAKKYLKKTGGLVLHLDWNANYLGRNLMEDVFGKDNFINEIVWRIGWVSGYKTQVDAFVRNHDTLYIFANSSRKDYFFRKSESKISYFSFKGDLIRKELESIKDKWSIKDKKIKNIKLVIKDDKNIVYKIGLETGSGAYNIEDTWNSSEYEDLHSNKIKRNAKEYTPHGAEITQKPEQLMQRIIWLTTEEGQLVFDYFSGSGTTVAVAHKLRRKWIGVELASYFESDILFRMKQVLSGSGKNEPTGISRDVNWQGGGFFKYYELEQYEEALANCKYEDGDLFNAPGRSPYQEYVFMKDEKMLKALEIDYKNNKVKVALDKLYPNIDIAETLSNLTGKWIKKISVDEVEFEDGTKINTKDLDYKLIKPLIWWE